MEKNKPTSNMERSTAIELFLTRLETVRNTKQVKPDSIEGEYEGPASIRERRLLEGKMAKRQIGLDLAGEERRCKTTAG